MKFLGFCLCPHCLTKKAHVIEMGMPADMEIHQNKIQIDDESLKTWITEAHKLIFQKGKHINGAEVKDLLGDKSLVLTRVIIWNLYSNIAKVPTISECFLRADHQWTVQLLPTVCGQSTTWIWVGCVEDNLHTSYAYLACCQRICCATAQLPVRCSWSCTHISHMFQVLTCSYFWMCNNTAIP